MSKRLDSARDGASVAISTRFDAATIAVIDREAKRLESLLGEECDRSKALRSIVRWFAAHEPRATAVAPSRAATSSPSVGSDTTEGGGIDPARNATVRARFVRVLGAHGVSVRAFCERFGVVRSTLQRFTAGRDLGAEPLDKIARAVDELDKTS